MAFKPIDAKRDEFRKYLERTGVLEAIAKVFVQLLSVAEKPENAIGFICENLGASKEQADENQRLKLELRSAHEEISYLKKIIKNLEAENGNINSSIIATSNNSSTATNEMKSTDHSDNSEIKDVSTANSQNTENEINTDDNETKNSINKSDNETLSSSNPSTTATNNTTTEENVADLKAPNKQEETGEN